MTVLLVLCTLSIFLTADYIVQRRRVAAGIREKTGGVFPSPALRLPDGVALAVNHTWLGKNPEGTATIGIDEWLGGVFGGVERIVLPPVHTLVSPAFNDVNLQSGTSSLNIASPVSGRVIEVNPKVLENPSLARSDPYGAGWLFKIKPISGGFSDQHLVRKPAEWLQSQTMRLKEFFSGQSQRGALVTMADGGVLVEGILQNCDDVVLEKFRQEFVVLRQTTMKN